MVELAAETAAYFSAVERAFAGLGMVAESEGDYRRRNNLLYTETTRQLERLAHSFACWKHKCYFADTFKIDRSESGFPLYRAVMELENEVARREENLLDVPEPRQIRDEMIELLLKYKQFPGELQQTMARRVYLDALGEAEVFPAFSPPRTLKHSLNPRTGRPFYVITWSAYDGTANLPMVYSLLIEDSSEDAPRRDRNAWTNDDDGWLAELEANGLPNFALRDKFRKFLETHSSYSLTLTSIATAMDETFDRLHPKQLRRFVLGPFYVGGLTNHNEKVQKILDGVKHEDDNWLLTWTMQELYSREEIAAKWGIWGGAPAKEIFHVNTDDVDCVAQGVSALERHALIPHGAYQATFAQGLSDEIFKDYRCYISSGEHVLRHV